MNFRKTWNKNSQFFPLPLLLSIHEIKAIEIAFFTCDEYLSIFFLQKQQIFSISLNLSSDQKNNNKT